MLDTLTQLLVYLIQTITGFFMVTLLLRFMLQVARAPFSHPIVQFVVKVTNFMVLPTRRLIPSVKGYDTASVLLAWLVAIAKYLLIFAVASFHPFSAINLNFTLMLCVVAFLELLYWVLTGLFATLLLQAILSWVSPINPLMPVLDALTRKLVAPVRKLVPRVGGLDLSFLVLILLVDITQRFLVSPLLLAAQTQMSLQVVQVLP